MNIDKELKRIQKEIKKASAPAMKRNEFITYVSLAVALMFIAGIFMFSFGNPLTGLVALIEGDDNFSIPSPVNETFTNSTDIIFNETLNSNLSGGAEVVGTTELVNVPPQWISITSFSIAVNDYLSLSLSDYFEDADGDEMEYDSTTADNLDVEVDGRILNIIPDIKFEGSRNITVSAFDGIDITEQEIEIVVGSEEEYVLLALPEFETSYGIMSGGTCNSSQWWCYLGGVSECIDGGQICDTVAQCTNNEDEEVARCSGCPLGQMVCEDGLTCITSEAFCNGTNECPLGMDENTTFCGEINETLGDFGDAPDSTNHNVTSSMYAYPLAGTQAFYPTVYDAATGLPQGPCHAKDYLWVWLGPNVSVERDADLLEDEDNNITNIDPNTNTPDREWYDDGLNISTINMTNCTLTNFTFYVNVSQAVSYPYYNYSLNVWFDWNRDGDWADDFTCVLPNDASEWAVRNMTVSAQSAGYFAINTTSFLPYNPEDNETWMRMTLIPGYDGITNWMNKDGSINSSGCFEDGETEDYWVNVSEIPTNPNCGASITSSVNLVSDMNCNGTAISFDDDNIILDCNGYTITGNGTGNGVYTLADNNVEIRNCIVSNFSTGIYAISMGPGRVINNTVTDSNLGIDISFTGYGIIANNTVSNNTKGVYCSEDCMFTQFKGNILEDNTLYGLNLTSSVVNMTIYNNYFSNTFNVYDAGLDNRWNTTYDCSGTNIIGGDCIGGNFWGNYTGTDSDADGIGETTYIISGSEIDYLPLTNVEGTPVNATYTNYSGNTTDFNSHPTPGNITNATIEIPSVGRIDWLGSVNATNQNFDLNVRIGNGYIFLNSSGLHQSFNSSANVTIHGLSGITNPKIMVDYDDDGNFEQCTDCTQLSWNGSTIVFNVTHFTNYTIQDNSAPTQETPTVNATDHPNNYTSANLTCWASATDIEGNNVSYSGYWYQNEVQNLSINTSGNYTQGITVNVSTLDSSYTSAGDNWSCKIKAYDGMNYSDYNSSNNITIINSLPNMTEATINTTQGGNTILEDLRCWLKATDLNEDDLSYNGFWYRNGTQYSSFNTSSITYEQGLVAKIATLDSSNTSEGDNWSCTGRAYDGENYSSYLSSTNITIGPALIFMDTVTINASYYQNTTHDNLTCLANSIVSGNANYDGMWYRNGVPYIYEEWQIKHDVDGNYDESYGVVTDSDGNIYMMGHARINGDDDYHIVKYDNEGNLVWNRTHTRAGDDFAWEGAIDPQGEYVYLTGESDDATGSGDSDYYLLKYDKDGNYIWNISYDIGNDTSYGVGADRYGNVYISGYVRNNGVNRAVTQKYNSTGDLIWTRTYGTNSTASFNMYTDSEGNTYFTGFIANSNNDVLTVKYDTNGTQVWDAIFDNGNTDVGYDVTVDQYGNVYVASPSVTSNGDYQFLTIKYNNNGQKLWNVTLDLTDNHDTPWGIVVDTFENVYVSGYYPSTAGDSQAFTIKYNENGEQIWNRTTVEEGVDIFIYEMAIDTLGNVFVTGTYENSSESDLYLLKYHEKALLDNQVPTSLVELATLDSSHTSEGENWSCRVRVDNETSYSDYKFSSDILINYPGDITNATILDPTSSISVQKYGWFNVTARIYCNASSVANCTVTSATLDPIPAEKDNQQHESEIVTHNENTKRDKMQEDAPEESFGKTNTPETSENEYSASATTVEILTGASQSSWIHSAAVYRTYWHDTRTQSVYLASDLLAAGMTAGTISEIQLYASSTSGRNLANFRIRMQETGSSTSTSWVTSGWTLVYGPTTVTAPTAGAWQTYTLSTPFEWDGSSNLLIDFSRDDTGYTTGGGMYVRTTAGIQTYGGYSDSGYTWPFDTMSGSSFNLVPSIKITYSATPTGPTVDINSIETIPSTIYETQSAQCKANVTANNTISGVYFNITYINGTNHYLDNGTVSGDFWTSSSFTVSENGTHTCHVYAEDNSSINDTDTLNFNVNNIITINSITSNPSSIVAGDSFNCVANVTGLNTISSVYFNITNPISSVTELGTGTQNGDIWTSSSYSTSKGGNYICTIKAIDNESITNIESNTVYARFNYSLTDITPTPRLNGTTTCTTADDGVCTVGLPFTFNFYNESYTEVYQIANGWIRFVNSGTTYNQWGVRGIYFYDRDLNPSACGTVTYDNTTYSNKVIFTWNNICHFGSTTPEHDGEIIIYNDSTIEIINGYHAVSDEEQGVHSGSSEFTQSWINSTDNTTDYLFSSEAAALPPLTVSNVQASETGVSIGTSINCSATASSGNSTVTAVNFTITKPTGEILELGNGTQDGTTWTSSNFEITNGGTWNCTAVAYDNLSVTASAFATFSAGDPGVIPMNSGTPFYTTSQNPTNSTYNSCLGSIAPGDYCNVTWLVRAMGNIGDTWEMFAYFNGSYEETNHFNVTIIAGINQAPEINSSFVNATTIYNKSSNDLYCWVNSTDNEDDNVSYSGYWYRNGVQNTSFNTSPSNYTAETLVSASTLDSSLTSSGENWSCYVRGYDGEDYGSYYMTANITIRYNGAPVISITDINTTGGNNYSNENIQCWANSSDFEQENVIYEGYWYRNGIQNTSFNTSASYAPATVVNVAVLNSFLTTSGENWSCKSRAYDGEDYSDYLSSTNMTILAPPININNIIINATSIQNTTEDNITCWVQATDKEGDNLNYEGNWYNDGALYLPNLWSDSHHVSTDKFQDGEIDSEGNFYVTGYTASTSDDWFTVKYDSEGNRLWNVTYSIALRAQANDLAVDEENSVYVGGYYRTGSADTTENWRLTKYNSTGSQKWTVTYDYNGNRDYITGVASDKNGYVYATGASVNANSDWFTRKYNDATGAIVWSVRYDSGGGEIPYAITTDNSGNVYVAGVRVVGSNSYDWLIIKYDSSGNYVWNATYSSPRADYAYGIELDSLGNVYVTGTKEVYNYFNKDYVTVKYDSSGNYVWNRTYDSNGNRGGRDVAYDIDIDSEDNIYVAGINQKNQFNIYLIKYDSYGNTLWSYEPDQFDLSQTEAYGMDVDANGDIYIAGWIYQYQENAFFVTKYAQNFSLGNQPSGALVNVGNLSGNLVLAGDNIACRVRANDGTNYSSYELSNEIFIEEGPLACGTARVHDTTLTENLTSYGSCLRLNADDITLDCAGYSITGTNVSNTYALIIKDKHNLTIKNCTLTNYGYAAYMINTSENTIIQNNIHDNHAGIWIDKDTSGNNISFNTIANSITDSGIVFNGNTHDNVIDNNYMNYSDYQGITFYEMSANERITNNIIDWADQSIEFFEESENITLINNSLDYYGEDAIVFYSSAENIWIENNSMEHIDGSSYSGLIFYDTADNITIIDNSIIDSDYAGIEFYDVIDNVLIANNTISDHPDEAGIVFYEPTTNVRIDNNIINNNSAAGIVFYETADDINITNNEINNNCEADWDQGGITFWYATSNVDIINNNINNNLETGIYFGYDAINVRIANNTVNNNSEYGGISFDYDADNVNITNNDIYNNNQTGIWFAGDTTNCNVLDNTISNSAEEGIWIGYTGTVNENNIFCRNTITDNGYHGIYLNINVDDSIICNNTITGNGNGISRYGIKIGPSSDENLIYNNYFDNTRNAYDFSATNKWNTTLTAGTNIIGKSYIGGNYWSDYTGSDTTGDYIGDTLVPYNQNITNGGDYLPLTLTTDYSAPTGGGGGGGGETPPPDPEPSCTDECSSSGTYCSGSSVMECSVGGDGCKDLDLVDICVSPFTCSGGSCVCSENWICSLWSECSIIGVQSCITFTDTKNCGTTITKPTSATQGCEVQETCSDGFKNQDETGVDCGGTCSPCIILPTCNDNIKNQGEEGVDCGGPCTACTLEIVEEVTETTVTPETQQPQKVSILRTPKEATASKPTSYGGCLESFYTDEVPELRIIDPASIRDLIKIPFGYEMISEPFQLQCAGGYYEIMLSVPEGFGDIRPLRCRGDQCSATEYIREEDFACGGSQIIERKTIREKDVITADEIKPILGQEKSITYDNNFIRSGNILIEFIGDIPPAMTAKLSSPTWAIPQPRNPSLAITGSPIIVQIETSFNLKIPARITLPYLEGENYDENSVGIYTTRRREGKLVWESVGGEVNKEEKTVTIEIENILDILENKQGLIAPITAVCENCEVSSFEKIYHEGDSRNAVVLVHGLDSSPATFNELIGDFAYNKQPWQIWTFGYSSNRPIETVAQELANFLQTHSNEFDTVSIVGHSLGGIITQEALHQSDEERKLDPNRYRYMNKVKRVVLIASPNEGSPGAQVYINLHKYISSLSESYSLFNVNSDVIDQLAKGFVIPRVPGIRYYVIAGTKSLEFNLGLFKVSTQEFFDVGEKNDGIVSTTSAQTVGGTPIDNLCKDYWEINADHSTIIDDPNARKFVEKILSESIADDAQQKGLIGYNQYFRLAVEDCSSEDYYVLVGKQIKESDICDACNCGDGICGDCENELTCQTDCGYIPERDFLGPMIIYIMLLMTFAVTGAYTIKKYLFQAPLGGGWIRAIITLVLLDTVLTGVYKASYKTNLWTAYISIGFVLTFTVGMAIWAHRSGFHTVLRLKQARVEVAEVHELSTRFNYVARRHMFRMSRPFRRLKEGISRLFMKGFKSEVRDLNKELKRLNDLDKAFNKIKKK